jgi:hypothetical protein
MCNSELKAINDEPIAQSCMLNPSKKSQITSPAFISLLTIPMIHSGKYWEPPGQVWPPP